MRHLLYDTFGDKSPVQLRGEIDDQTLDEIPLFRTVEEYLKIIQRDKQIKLTPLGALPKKVLVELYDKRFLLEEFIENGISELWREQDCLSISSARLAAELGGLVRKANGKLTLTKKATELLKTNKRNQLFRQFFQAFTDKFLWNYNDNYPEQPIGQLGWAFSAMMLDKYGDQQRTVEFYAAKYLRAFPSFITFFRTGYATPEQQFSGCYGVRTFDRFFLWFGFVTDDERRSITDLEKSKFKRTDLAQRLFKIDH